MGCIDLSFAKEAALHGLLERLDEMDTGVADDEGAAPLTFRLLEEVPDFAGGKGGFQLVELTLDELGVLARLETIDVLEDQAVVSLYTADSFDDEAMLLGEDGDEAEAHLALIAASSFREDARMFEDEAFRLRQGLATAIIA